MDKALANFVRSLQLSQNADSARRLLPTATGLLTRLSNPLNLTLLSSQLLSHPFLYSHPEELASSRDIFSVFYTAASRYKHETKALDRDLQSRHPSVAEWVKALTRGADERSPVWRHLLLLGGLLLGFSSHGEDVLEASTQEKLAQAIVTATNHALDERQQNPDSCLTIAFVINATFPLLADQQRSQIAYDSLLPVLIDAALFSPDGLGGGYWLGAIDQDLTQSSQQRFSWQPRSSSATRIREMRSKPLVAAISPLARLIAHAIEHASHPDLIVAVSARLTVFSRNIALSWRQNRLSEVSPGEEQHYLDAETLQTSLPDLLQLLRNTLFALTIILRSLVGRLLVDSVLSSPRNAPLLVTNTLNILRDTYFIAHKFDQANTSQYLFVHLACIDILSQYPSQAETFIQTIKPVMLGRIPNHPLERIHDLFFLNTAEHFTLTLSPDANETVLINGALPYITPDGPAKLTDLYEAAHSTILAVFGAPHNAQVSAKYLPLYVETLLHSFPGNLNASQFRLATRTVMQIAAPQNSLYEAMPTLQEVMLELLSARILSASEQPIGPANPSENSHDEFGSERAVLTQSIIEALPYLEPSALQQWLSHSAQLINGTNDIQQRQDLRERFWTILSNGSMDVTRAAVCVAWWTNDGGREITLQGHQSEYSMSGGVQ